MDDRVAFRKMEVRDIEKVLRVEKACFRNPWTRQAFYNELTHNQFACYILAELEGDTIGYGGMWLIINEAHITNIAIHPDMQGKRFGLRLMLYLMGLAKLRGADKMTLEVRRSNEKAKNLYQKLGFTVTGVRPGYYSDNFEDALIMWVDIDDTLSKTWD